MEEEIEGGGGRWMLTERFGQMEGRGEAVLRRRCLT